MIDGFDVKDQVLGTGENNQYTFDFKIFELTDLLIWVQDGSGNIVEEIRGDDTTFIQSVVFDSLNGGGTVTLVNDLADTYVMTFLLAIDDPSQPTSFPSKSSFSLDVLEGALDYLAACIQRAAYLGQRASVLHDLDDIDSFNPTLPLGIGSHPGGVISVKADGSGFEVVLATGEIVAAEGYATVAQAAQSASSASATAAALSALAAAASAAGAQAAMAVYGTPGAPENVVAANGIAFHIANQQEAHWAQGNGGNVIVTANPQITTVGVVQGQRIMVYGANDAQTVKLTNGNGLSLNGDCILGQDDCLGLMFDGTNWSEMFRRSAT